MITAGELKVGLVGASPEGPLNGAEGKPVIPAVLAEAKRLREKDKVDVVVVLAAVPYVDPRGGWPSRARAWTSWSSPTRAGPRASPPRTVWPPCSRRESGDASSPAWS